MRQQDWQEVEERLKSFYSPVKLRCDGYEVTLCLERLDQFKNAIRVYVNGIVKGAWLIEDCEESRRFFKPITKSLLTNKEIKSRKKLVKKILQKYKIEPDPKYTYYRPYWTSFRSLKSHLIKNNSSIELWRDEHAPDSLPG